MSAKFYMTSSDVIASVKRKIAIPIAQNTFTEDDILAFTNEVMMSEQVPSVLQYHEEYFNVSMDVPLANAQYRYVIPERAIGQKLRDLFFKDFNGNMYPMVRINPDDKSIFQRGSTNSSNIYSYYHEGNDIVLVPGNDSVSATGYLVFTYYLRPNMLVPNSRAAICTDFTKLITISNSLLVIGDWLSITYTNPNGSLNVRYLVAGTDFMIGITSDVTAMNLQNAINALNLFTTTISANKITIQYSDLKYTFSSNSAGINVDTNISLGFDKMPDNFKSGMVVDILQTNSGHRLYAMDVQIPSNGISGLYIQFPQSEIPVQFKVGDYVCEQYECIIPQIPDDLHTILVDRVCARILAAQGDQAGLMATNAKLAETSDNQSKLIDNRNDGAAQKIVAHYGLLRYNRFRPYRRY